MKIKTKRANEIGSLCMVSAKLMMSSTGSTAHPFKTIKFKYDGRMLIYQLQCSN